MAVFDRYFHEMKVKYLRFITSHIHDLKRSRTKTNHELPLLLERRACANLDAYLHSL